MPHLRHRLSALLLSLLLLGGCASQGGLRNSPAAESSVVPSEPAEQNLNAVLWFQTATEYRAVLWQLFADATTALTPALADPGWSADPQQAQPATGLRPAVVVDVDETMLDNSPYQARLIRDGGVYEETSWRAWCEERRAAAIPGALEFARQAQAAGVDVYYVSNRDISLLDATVDNLRSLGFPNADPAFVLLRDRARGWYEKGPRRAHIARSHRILLLIGDNLGDFSDDYKGDASQRQALLDGHRHWWGERWFMLPNPMYGSWEQVLIDYDYRLPAAEQDARRRGALRME